MKRLALVVALSILFALAVLALAIDAEPQEPLNLSNAFKIVPGAAQGGRGDLLFMPAGTIQGVHVVQGGSRECLDPNIDTIVSCSERLKSLNLDIGAGSATHRGQLALNYDVGDQTRIFNGRKRIRIRVHKTGVRLYGKVEICNDGTCIDLFRAIRGLRERK